MPNITHPPAPPLDNVPIPIAAPNNTLEQNQLPTEELSSLVPTAQAHGMADVIKTETSITFGTICTWDNLTSDVKCRICDSRRESRC